MRSRRLKGRKLSCPAEGLFPMPGQRDRNQKSISVFNICRQAAGDMQSVSGVLDISTQFKPGAWILQKSEAFGGNYDTE